MPPSPSPSGFASLRARFEQNKQDNDTSPPSRGRSPAGSITTDQARPLSKIRTNFVAVEPSGHTLDGSMESKIAKSSQHVSGGPIIKNGAEVAGPSFPKETENVANKTGSSTEATTKEGAQDLSQSLGSILKGSPFEEDSKRDAAFDQAIEKQQSKKPEPVSEAVKPSKPSSGSAKTQGPPTQKPKAGISGADIKANGRPKDVTTKSTAEKNTNLKPSATAQGIKPKSLSTKAAPPNATTASSTTAETAKDERSERTNGIAHHASGALAEGTSNPKGAPTSTTNKAASLAKSVVKPIKKAIANPAPASKPRPRSPTRPVKLPAAATAGTTSSNAKHDESTQPSRSPSRQSNAPTVSKTRIDSLSRPKSVRASLPANSKPLTAKPKSKSRASLAPGPAPSGSFLERMMRPTQSSAQKVHERTDPPSPPRRNLGSGNHAVKPKRKSGESSGNKSDEGQKELAPLVDLAAPSSAAPVDLTPLPLTDDTAVQSHNVAQEIQNTAPAPEPVI